MAAMLDSCGNFTAKNSVLLVVSDKFIHNQYVQQEAKHTTRSSVSVLTERSRSVKP